MVTARTPRARKPSRSRVMTRSVMGPSHPHQQVGEYSAGGARKRAAASLAVGAESCCQGRAAADRAATAKAPASKLRMMVMVFSLLYVIQILRVALGVGQAKSEMKVLFCTVELLSGK